MKLYYRQHLSEVHIGPDIRDAMVEMATVQLQDDIRAAGDDPYGLVAHHWDELQMRSFADDQDPEADEEPRGPMAVWSRVTVEQYGRKRRAPQTKRRPAVTAKRLLKEAEKPFAILGRCGHIFGVTDHRLRGATVDLCPACTDAGLTQLGDAVRAAIDPKGAAL